jgi:SAM-dependent methyltransferase
MMPGDRQDYIERYSNRLATFGYSPETLGWGKKGRQFLRFSVLAAEALLRPECSVLDVGCGFADLYDFLIQNGWHGRYVGIDIVKSLLDVAQTRHPQLDLFEMDIADAHSQIGEFDFVLACGIFNAELPSARNQQHIQDTLADMHRCAKIATCADFMTTLVDFRKPGSWHTDPQWLLGVLQGISRRHILRFDYMPFEYSAFCFRDDSVNNEKVFSGFLS